jgi:hypothetical protein
LNCHCCGTALGDDDGTEIKCNDCGRTLFAECDNCEDNELALFTGLDIIEKHGCHTAQEAIGFALNEMIDGGVS